MRHVETFPGMGRMWIKKNNERNEFNYDTL
jgi:hypothetical protein